MHPVSVDLPAAVRGLTGSASMTIRPMTRDELDVLVDWAAGEGWNPGLHDADAFWATDPDGFVAADIEGALVGGGSVVAYGGEYGFMGLFIVRPDLRQHGLGGALWPVRRDLLRGRLDEGAAVEMDGVFEMQPFYAKGGFVFQQRDLRFEGQADAAAPPAHDVVELADMPFAAVEAYDRAHFPASRRQFLESWISGPDAHAVGVHDGGSLQGYAVARPCRVGYKIGPLFADDPTIAESLFRAVSSRLAGARVYLDVPEPNAAAMDLVRRHGMVEVFGCARMTLGPPPSLPWDEIFGVTTLELG